jgi:hypothetical protein
VWKINGEQLLQKIGKGVAMAGKQTFKISVFFNTQNSKGAWSHATANGITMEGEKKGLGDVYMGNYLPSASTTQSITTFIGGWGEGSC